MLMNATVSVRNDAVTTGEHYRYAAPYREAGDDTSPEPETESGAFYARLHHERELNRSARIHLFSNAAHISPGRCWSRRGCHYGPEGRDCPHTGDLPGSPGFPAACVSMGNALHRTLLFPTSRNPASGYPGYTSGTD